MDLQDRRYFGTAQLILDCPRVRSSACSSRNFSSASATVMSETSSDCGCISWYGTPQGCHRPASELPKKQRIGFPSAAATCIAPPTLQMTCSQTASPANRSDSVMVG